MPNKIDLSGRKFGDLTAISESGRDRHGAVMWKCSCACGNTSVVRGSILTQGIQRSCGCAKKEPRTHGMTGTPLHRRWLAMKGRCMNPRNWEYRNYGGRGISICDRWLHSFENFYEDMHAGFDESLELDRINVNGNYEPSNCRWVSRREQQRNRRNNHVLMVGAVSKTVIEWAEDTGLKANTIITRIRRGWPVERLLEIANSSASPANHRRARRNGGGA